MKIRPAAIVAALLFPAAAFPQSVIHLTGTIIDAQTRRPLPGAYVKLLGAGLVDTTDSAGHFGLVRTTSTLIPAFPYATSGVSLRGDRIELLLPTPSSVVIDLFDASGARVKAIAGGAFSQGAHAFPLGLGAAPQGLFLLRVRTGSQLGLLKLTWPEGCGVGSWAVPPHSACGPAKRAAGTLDTLMAWRDGYVARKIPISLLVGNIDTSLYAQPPTGANVSVLVKCNDSVPCADTLFYNLTVKAPSMDSIYQTGISDQIVWLSVAAGPDRVFKVQVFSKSGAALGVWQQTDTVYAGKTTAVEFLVGSGGGLCGWIVTAAEEKTMGDNFRAKMLADTKDYPLYTKNPAVNAYVDSIGKKIAQREDTSFAFTFDVIDDTIVNAFSIPGGHVFVYAGLIRQTRNEAELASVIAHEIAHVANRHGLKSLCVQQARVSLTGLTTGDSTAITQAVDGLLMLTYSRDNEFQADTCSVHYLIDYGLNPYGMKSFLETLVRLYGDSPQCFEPLSDHPPTSDRITLVQQVIDHSSWPSSDQTSHLGAAVPAP